MIEFTFYSRIRYSECLSLRWTKGESEAPGLVGLVNRFNIVGQWVATSVVAASKLKERVQIAKHFIRTAYACYELNNLSSAMQILAGLQQADVARLKKTWDDIAKTKVCRERLNYLEQLFMPRSNFKAYRDHVGTLRPPAMPYVGVYMSDLTFIEEGNPNTLKRDDFVNFEKFRMTSRIINQILRFQKAPYALESNPMLDAFLRNPQPVLDDKVHFTTFACADLCRLAINSHSKSSHVQALLQHRQIFAAALSKKYLCPMR